MLVDVPGETTKKKTISAPQTMMIATNANVIMGDIAFLSLVEGSLFTNAATHVLSRAHRYCSSPFNLCRAT